MANSYGKEFVLRLHELAFEYMQECVQNTRPHVAGNGKVIQVPDRHIPTIGYFLNVWLPIVRKEKTINRDTYYTWLRGEADEPLKTDTIKTIDDMFKNLAKDIVANEGKGIFYAKNALGMHDRQQVETRNVDRFDFE